MIGKGVWKEQNELKRKITSMKQKKVLLHSTTAIVLVVIITIEVTIIVMGNVFTIFVFWTPRDSVWNKLLFSWSASLWLICVGLGQAPVLATNTILNGENEILQIESPCLAFQVFESSTSLMFLAVISLERVYSVLWPFRHRNQH